MPSTTTPSEAKEIVCPSMVVGLPGVIVEPSTTASVVFCPSLPVFTVSRTLNVEEPSSVKIAPLADSPAGWGPGAIVVALDPVPITAPPEDKALIT